MGHGWVRGWHGASCHEEGQAGEDWENPQWLLPAGPCCQIFERSGPPPLSLQTSPTRGRPLLSTHPPLCPADLPDKRKATAELFQAMGERYPRAAVARKLKELGLWDEAAQGTGARGRAARAVLALARQADNRLECVVGLLRARLRCVWVACTHSLPCPALPCPAPTQPPPLTRLLLRGRSEAMEVWEGELDAGEDAEIIPTSKEEIAALSCGPAKNLMRAIGLSPPS